MRRLTGLLVVALVGCAGGPPGSGGGVDPDGNHIPEARFFKCTPEAGLLPLDTTCAWEINDADGEAVRCVIDKGPDGNPEQVIENCGATGAVQLKLTELGPQTIRLFLVDARSATAYLDTTVVTTAPPNIQPKVLSFSADPPSGGAPLNVTFSFSVGDEEGDALTCRLLEADQVIVQPSDCGFNQTRTATLAQIGMHRVTLEVTDPKGGRATQDVNVEVTALPQVGDLRISKIEWGQTVVTTSPRLVAGKDALLRVYVLSERSGISGVTVTATGTRNGTMLGELTLTGPAIAPQAEVPNDLARQWSVVVPAAWVEPGMQVQVRVDPLNRLGETNEMNNESVQGPAIGKSSVLAVTNVPVVQSGRTGTVRNIEQAMKQIWPLSGINAMTRAAYTYSGTVSTNGSGWSSLLDQLLQLRRNDGSRRNYLGWISLSGGSGVAGLGFVGIGAALTRDDTIATSVHELGHNMGREHAPCGGASGADPQYPVANARLDVQGWDFVSNELIVANQSFDIMSYCDPQWVSNYNYKAVQAFLESRPVSSSSPPLVSSPYIVVNGRIAEDGVALNPLTLIEAASDAEIEPGEYTLTLHGERTVTVPFGTSRVADGGETYFALVVPKVEGLYAVEISRAGKQLALKLAGPQRPPQQVAVKNVPGGIELSWNAAAFRYASVAHLGDEGHTTLSLWAEGGKAFVSTSGLADGGAFEVSLSDGVQSQRLVVAR